ncbi:uncharacterized protein LOC109824225 [Asparagus officinalis]|uniref:uncharacterized protein LOC109824225 n=1 Tax=Asparagus officinalis TaxID=4686 RepID=UPI00098E6183|nr:uncharacterized protein LOC109824225 [Asparagus officinalis]
MTSIRTLIVVATAKHWSLYQMDVKNAFFNDDLSETVYMQPPPSFPAPPGHACCLCHAIYGIKQAPRAWFERFRQSLLSISFIESLADYALFYQSSASGTVILLLYVDDMIITRSDSSTITSLKQHLQSQFEMKDLGSLRYFLGIEVASSSCGYILSQQKYITDILECATLSDPSIATTPLFTPMEINLKLRHDDGHPLSQPTRYRELVGVLVYLSATCPDIAYAVHILSQFVSSPTFIHYAALIWVLGYLRGIITKSLSPPDSSLSLRAYSDVGWADDVDTRRFTTDFCIFWDHLSSLGVVSVKPLSLVLRDNKSVIAIFINPVFYERTKYIKVDCHVVRQEHVVGNITLSYVPSKE